MNLTFGQILVWVIIGALAGSLVGFLVKGRRKGFGLVGNLLVGLLGAVIGGVLFDVLDIDLGLGAITFTGEDLVAAIVGSLLVLAVVFFLRRR